MKKLLAICLTLVLVMCMSVTAFAAGGFVKSPSGNEAPTITDTDKDEDCPAEVVITPYGDRDDLSEEDRKAIEEAYKDILENEDLTKLVEELKEIAEELGVDPTSLSVSELFDVSIEGCTDHSKHGNIDVTIRPNTLNNYAALLAFENGKWTVVKTVVNNDALKFTADKWGPYAIVLSKTNVSPQTSDATPYALAVIAFASVIGVAVLAKSKKFEA